MPRKPSANTVPTTIKLPQAWLDRADYLAAQFGDEVGTRIVKRFTRTEILRFAVEFGLKDIEAEVRAYRKKQKQSRKRKSSAD